ncbi:hypothetical protein HQQ80_09770 [Microbacteriaceae bacterium VKM Ac-2855]|nr:hypothetical protein [Microbacteriaceae bacterium VKM Ac-2855]
MSSDAETQRIDAAETQRTREYVWPTIDPGPDARTTVLPETRPPAATPLGPVEPEPVPRRRGNRSAGLLIALLATAVYFVIDLAAVAALRMLQTGDPFADAALALATAPAVLAPTLGFAIALAVIVLLVDRAGWWAYVLGGFLVAVVCAASAIVGLWIENFGLVVPTADALRAFLGDTVLIPFALAAAVVAREVTVWAGAWIGARGRRLRLRP